MQTVAIVVSLIFFAQSLLWAYSLVVRDVSLVDRCWGLGFVLIGVVTFAQAESWNERHFLVLLLVFCWGLRLSAHIHLRNRGKGEDARYRAMRDSVGAAFLVEKLLYSVPSPRVLDVCGCSAYLVCEFGRKLSGLFYFGFLGHRSLERGVLL